VPVEEEGIEMTEVSTWGRHGGKKPTERPPWHASLSDSFEDLVKSWTEPSERSTTSPPSDVPVGPRAEEDETLPNEISTDGPVDDSEHSDEEVTLSSDPATGLDIEDASSSLAEITSEPATKLYLAKNAAGFPRVVLERTSFSELPSLFRFRCVDVQNEAIMVGTPSRESLIYSAEYEPARGRRNRLSPGKKSRLCWITEVTRQDIVALTSDGRRALLRPGRFLVGLVKAEQVERSRAAGRTPEEWAQVVSSKAALGPHWNPSYTNVDEAFDGRGRIPVDDDSWMLREALGALVGYETYVQVVLSSDRTVPVDDSMQASLQEVSLARRHGR
jgi:hypothetical protein